MAYRASFSSKSSRSGLISSYGIEIFFCFLLCFFFLVSSYTQNNFFLKTKYYVIAFSEPGLKIISAPFDMIGKSFSSVTEIKEIKKKNTLLINEDNLLKQQLKEMGSAAALDFRGCWSSRARTFPTNPSLFGRSLGSHLCHFSVVFFFWFWWNTFYG